MRTASARSAKRSCTSPSRPNACTISIPTTASLADSVTSALRCWTSREIGITRCAKRHATSAISGSGSALHSASDGFTGASTMPAPTSIIRLCAPCTSPQPMK